MHTRILYPGLVLAAFSIAALPSPSTKPVAASAAVAPSERGAIFALPFDSSGPGTNTGDWAGMGLAIFKINNSSYFRAMSNTTIKAGFGRLGAFGPADETGNAMFPWTRFVALDKAEVSAGRPSMLVTATYAGRNRPVYTRDNVAPDANNWPTRPRSSWLQAVSLSDPRFVNFWVNSYVQPIVLQASSSTQLPNMWVGSDACTFSYASQYGIIDDSGKWVSGVTWDAAFPQSNAALLSSVSSFTTQVHAAAPALHAMCNLGSLDDYTQFQQVFGGFDGIEQEDMQGYYTSGVSFRRMALYQRISNLQTWARLDKVAVVGFQHLPSGAAFADQLRRAYIQYLMVRGSQFFFSPQVDTAGSAYEVDPLRYKAMSSALGPPVGPASSSLQVGSLEGYRLYWRRTTNGIAYLNWSGITQTITLPADSAWNDRNGAPTGQLVIPDMSADYAVVSSQLQPAVTKVSPAVGPTSGGSTLTITGTNLTGATSVTFWGKPALSFRVDSPTSITAVTPPRPAGLVDINVTTAAGKSNENSGDYYRYQ